MRKSINKHRSSQKFRKQLRTTKGANIARPQRGGTRL